jgi:hypothetical protein
MTYEGGLKKIVARVFARKKILTLVLNYVGCLSGSLSLKFVNSLCIRSGDRRTVKLLVF